MKVQIKNNEIVEHTLIFKDRESAIKWCESHKTKNPYDDENNRLAVFNNTQYVIDKRKFHSIKTI